jgi:hypothetical protein
MRWTGPTWQPSTPMSTSSRLEPMSCPLVSGSLPAMQKTDAYPRPEIPLDQYLFFGADPRHDGENK